MEEKFVSTLLLTVEEAADQVYVHPNTILRWIQEYELPVRGNDPVRIDSSAFQSWLDAQHARGPIRFSECPACWLDAPHKVLNEYIRTCLACGLSWAEDPPEDYVE